jgi:hypothetical protein
VDVDSIFLMFQDEALAGWRVVEGPHFLRLAAAGAERYHRREFVFRILDSSLTLLKLLFYDSVVEGRYFAPSPLGRIPVSFQVAKFAPVGLHVKIVVHLFLPIVESVHGGVAHFILSVHMHFGQRR